MPELKALRVVVISVALIGAAEIKKCVALSVLTSLRRER